MHSIRVVVLVALVGVAVPTVAQQAARGVTYGHSGFMPGHQTDVMYFPELKAAVAVQVNSSAPRSTGRPLRAFLTAFAEVIAQHALAGRGR